MDLEITLKAIVDFTSTDPAILAGSGLQPTDNEIAMSYRFYNAQNQNPPGAQPGIYIPLKARVSLNGAELDAYINDPNDPSVTGSCYVSDNTFNWYDQCGFHYSTRDVVGNHPFGALDRIQFSFMIDEGARSGTDLPGPNEDATFMNNHQRTYLFFHSLTGGALGNGLDSYFGSAQKTAIDIRQI